MRRWTLLVAGAALWLFLAAIPALADGGPHVASVNSGSSSLTADSCAGCHRAHTASGPLLLNAPTEEALCLTCHGAAVTGATTDVMTGIQYWPVSATDGTRSGTQLGALRNGGFDQARIGDPFRIALASNPVAPATPSPSRKSKVQVGAAANVTSAHLEMAENGLSQPGVAWGNGANGSGAGPVVSISCGSCHNPHGNGAYRILNPIPSVATGSINPAWTARIVDVSAGTFRTVASHSFLIGDSVTVKGNTLGPDVTATVATVPSNTSFTLTGVAGTGTGGTATRNGGVKVTDAANAANATRNYTVIQTKGPSYALLASDVTTDAATGDYLHYQVPWNAVAPVTATPPNTPTYNLDAPNGIPGGTDGLGLVGSGGFGEQITAWCSSCHTRYMAYSEPKDASGGTGAAYNTARPGASDGTFSSTKDSVYTYQHRTRGASGRSCVTCHVSHGTNAVMGGDSSKAFTYPDGTASASSRLLKVGNRGTCQLCHDPTGTIKIGDQYPAGPIPGTP